MKSLHKTIGLLVLLLASLLGSAVLADEPVDGRAGRAEVRFLEGMIDHHQMALDMAADCLAKAETEAVRTLCQNVIDAQSAEISTMQAWLLGWYGVEYAPMSMLGGQPAAGGTGGMMGGEMGMGMMGDMSSMMGMMSDMMQNMSGMMEMMSGMMGGGMGMMGDAGDMGMMGGEGGMGMMGGMGAAQGGAAAMPDMSMMRALRLMSVMGSLRMGELLDQTADLDAASPLMDILEHHGGQPDMGQMGSMMGDLTMGQMQSMFAEMGNLTIGDMREMMGHLDDGANATIMQLMQHHMDVMVGGGSAAESAGDHEAHHPEAEVTPEPTEDHAAHHPAAEATPEPTDHAQHQSGADPSMMMGMMAGLHALTGTDYEIAWLEAMIDHHDDALHMAERLLERAPEGTGHAELRALAEQIISDQTAEIDAMEALIAELSS